MTQNVLEYIPDQYKTQEMCNKAVFEIPWALKYVPDYFVTKEMMKMDYNKVCFCCKNFYESYYKRKKLKKDIHEELALIAWHPNRWWDWCVDIDEKREVEKLW